MPRAFHVYILTNKTNRVLYTGVTNDLVRRVYEHREKRGSKFTTRYSVNKLVYFEACDNAEQAILREKQIKAGSRARKIALIEGMNPKWNDLWQEIASPPNGGSQ